MIRIITILSFSLISTAMLAQTEPCDCEWQFDETFICAQDSLGTIFPVPNTCIAECLGLTVVDSTECDLDGYDGHDDYDWQDGDQSFNCECEVSDFEGAGICIEITESYDGDTLTYEAWAPSECYADCWGYENYVVVECDTTGFEWDYDWDNDWDNYGCECEVSDFEGAGICIEITESYNGDTLTYESWVPSECYAACWGYENYVIVECDTTGFEWDNDWDNDWDNYGCECEVSDFEGAGICIEITESYNGDTLTYESWAPSECYADCWGYENYVIVECDTTGFEWDNDWDNDWDNYGCECEVSDFEGAGICIEITESYNGDTLTYEAWAPSECYADCWGYENYVIVECDTTGFEWDNDWDNDWDNYGCECEVSDFEGAGICIEITESYNGDTLTYEAWAPSECYADCWGYENYVVVECDTTGFEWDNDWDNDWDNYGCECEVSDFEGAGICIEITESYDGDTLTYEAWAPSECYADCWGYENYVVVECDTTGFEWDNDWDNDWDNYGCECEVSDFEGAGICIEITELYNGDTLTYESWVPSECYADCWGYENYVIVECDTTGFEWDNDWDNDWDNYSCECEVSDFEGAGICIEITESYNGDTLTYEAWAPSECYADCWGYENYVVVECDTTGYDNPWNDCDCQYTDADEYVCVITDAATGEISPFLNMCYAECAGYTAADVVDCDFPELECLDCLDDEIIPVCVQDSLGNTFPVPNICFADCLGLTVVNEADCGGFIDGNTVVEDLHFEAPLPQHVSAGEGNISIRVYPNPVTDNITLEFELDNQESLTTMIIDAQGKVINQDKQTFLKGLNTNRINVSELTPGIYIVALQTSNSLVTQRFIKN